MGCFFWLHKLTPNYFVYQIRGNIDIKKNHLPKWVEWLQSSYLIVFVEISGKWVIIFL